VKVNEAMVHLGHYLSVMDRHILMETLEDLGSLSRPGMTLTTLGGTPYDPLAFASFVMSFILIFLMFFDFLHLILK